MSGEPRRAVAVPLTSSRVLSPMQRSLWASQLGHPDAPVQNMPLLSHLDGPVDPHRLARAFETVVERSDVLRTRLTGRDASTGQWNVELLSPTELPETEIAQVASDDVDEWARTRGRLPIDLSVCGYDSAIAVHEDGTVSWYLGLHHVITDATSSALVFDATATAYSEQTESVGTGASVDHPEASYYAWSRNLSASLKTATDTMTARSAAYWRDREAAPRIGRLYTPVTEPAPEAQRLPLGVDRDFLDRADARLSADYRMLTDEMAWSTVLMTATAIYLHRVTGSVRFSLGMPVHNRSHPTARTLIGPTMEVFPVDIEIELGDTYGTLRKRVGQSILTTLRHAAPGTSPSPDFEAIVNVIPRAKLVRFGSTPATTRWLHSGAIDSSHLLRVQMTGYAADVGPPEDADDPSTGEPPTAGSVTGGVPTRDTADPAVTSGAGRSTDQGPEFAIDLNEGACNELHRRRAVSHFTSILNELIDCPDDSIGNRTVCGPAELERLAHWEVGPEVTGLTPLLPDRLKAVLAENPSPVLAPTWNDRGGTASDAVPLTGRQLWRWIASCATWLSDQGVGPGTRVGVELPRSAEAVVAIMATMVAGGSFVPLDPVQPRSRLDRLIERADCAVVLSSVVDVAALRPSGSTTASTPDFEPVGAADSDEAYLLFTSGSTGEPKGVPITHGGLARYIRFAEESYQVGVARDELPVAPLFSALTFDLTITSLFMPILTGGLLVVVPEDGPAGLAAIASTPTINWCKATPSHLDILIRLLPPDHRLSTLVVGGEAFGSRLASELLDFNPNLKIFNEYGPTEAVVGCMIHQVDRTELDSMADVPIGVPAPGVSLAVLDEHLKRVPIGAPGELCISHRGVTAGYLGSEGADTAAAPADDNSSASPFVEIDGRRYYRSGDLVRLNEDDKLVYLGRKDEQLKVGGIRLDPIEVEQAITAHPAIGRSAVRLWSPAATSPSKHCRVCGLPDNVPGVAFDDDGVCETCHAYQRVAPVAQSWFRSREDLAAKRDEMAARKTGPYDCLHLLSGDKDSTYALYQLVELGFHPYVLTLDNGFISEGAKDNVRRSVAELGLDHEFATSDSMNEIFRDSLERHSNVCHGCYKTIYTLATTRADQIGAPLIVTGLSRGQLFETRLIPQQFDQDRFDPEAIDRAVLEARKVYHRVDDGPNRLLDTDVFASDEVFERIEYLDFYRYVDVELSEMLRFLEQRAPWVRPKDTGRSTNCLINAAGIHTHQTEQGYHNYAIPYAWDVRLGHKTRDEAIEELDDQLDLREVGDMLGAVGYRPRPRRILTAWLEPADADTPVPTPAELRAFLNATLPTHAIPSAFVEIDELPLTTNGKLDERALPGPKRVHRPGPTLQVSETTEIERSIIEVWERIIQVEPIGPDDDFFALGGDSLAALEMIVALDRSLGRSIGEDLAFAHTTARSLAAAIEAGEHMASSARPAELVRYSTPADEAPELSPGELAVLFDQGSRPNDIMYNVGRVYEVDGVVDAERFEQALRAVATRHQSLSWSYGSPRRPLDPAAAVHFERAAHAVEPAWFEDRIFRLHRERFDLDNGPLLRCVVQPLAGSTPRTGIFLAVHHASGDAGGFDRLWSQIEAEMAGRPVTGTGPDGGFDYAGFCRWQADSITDAQRRYWLDSSGTEPPSHLAIHRPAEPEPDGFLTMRSQVSPAQLRAAAPTGPASCALAALNDAVSAYSDGPEIEIGLITSTRRGREAADLFGYFLNPLPIRLQGRSIDTSMADLVARAASSLGGALANRTYPAARIMADRQAAGRPTPNLDVLMAFDELEDVTLDGARTRRRVLSNGSAVAPLTFFFEVRDEQVDLSVEYRGSICDQATAQDLLRLVDNRLATITGSADDTSSQDQSLLLGSPLDDDRLVMTRIADNVLADGAGEATAAVCGDERLTWADLGRRAHAVADALKSQGVQPGDPVLLCLPRSTNLIAAMLGIQLAGAAYVPIDPGYPEERIALIARTAEATVGLVDRANAQLVDTAVVIDRSQLTIDGIPGQPWHQIDRDEPRFDTSLVTGDGTAYVLFTSGSTGRPRGVPVSHQNLASSTNARSGVYPEVPRSFLTISSIAFDSSIVGLFWTLAEGGTVVLPTEDQAHDIPALHDLLSSGVTHTLMVPTLYQALVARPQAPVTRPAGSVQPRWPDRVIVAGEACPPSLVASHFDAYPDSALTNEYGPTEATVWATAHHCRPGDGTVPIGQPIPGTWAAVIDHRNRIRPAGVEGDLIIGGRGVTAGYLNDPAATEAGFDLLPADVVLGQKVDGFGRRFFRTGDRATVVDGAVRFLGRSDSQLNVGGVRAEPEDIENVLVDIDGVTAAVVVGADVRDLKELLDSLPKDVVATAMADAAGAVEPTQALLTRLRAHGRPELRIVAHIERPAVNDRAADVELERRLRSSATASLPAGIRPSRYQLHDELPRTPNGKVDRAAAAELPLSTEPGAVGPVGPKTDGSDGGRGEEDPIVASLTELFGQALRTESIGPDDSFFDHGGHSLLAMELLLQIEERHRVRIPPATLYAAPTPRELSASVTPARGTGPNRARGFLVPIQPDGELPPIFAVHVLGIDCQFFRPLSARLGTRQPMYGLGQPTTALDTAGPTEVAAVAEVYADEIDRVAPDGPISLAAISLGGVVAYELAQQLVRRGRDVTLLALFDALGPDAVINGPSPSRRVAAHLQRATEDPARYAREQMFRQGQKLTRTRERAHLALRRSLKARTDHTLEVRRFIEDNLNAQWNYNYEPYPGNMLVIKAEDDPFADFYVQAKMGWKHLALGSLTIEISPGAHLSMMEEPHVEVVADALERALSEAAASDSSPDRQSVDGLLIRALRTGELPATVARLTSSPQGPAAGLSPESTELAQSVDRLLLGLAQASERAADEVAQTLARAGVETTIMPVPRRLQHATAVLQVLGDPAIADRAMETLGYHSVDRLAGGALGAAVNGRGRVDYIRRDANTARIRLQWRAPAAGRLSRVTGPLTPSRRDFDVVDLPTWAWPAYWPIRPARLMRDRIRSTAGSTGGGPADLGIFLGTPPGLIEPLLRFAELGANQLIIDIGCGDGRVLVAAARIFHCRARGYETDADLVERARAAAEAAGVGHLVDVVHGDANEADVSDADVVFAFLPPKAVASLLGPTLNQLPKTSTFLSHEQLETGFPVDPDRSGLVVGLGSDPADGGITVANLWFGRSTR